MYRKRERNLWLKKSAAIVTASAMVMSVPVTAMAEGMTYCDREKAALKSLCESLAKDWDASLAQTKESGNNAKANITLKLNEAGQSMVGMMTQMDMSWLKSISMDMDVSIADSKEAVKAAFLLNDTNLCTMNVVMNWLEALEYVQIPELSPSWMKASLDMTADGEAVSAETMDAMMGLASDPAVLLPEGATVSDLLDRYGNIVIDHMQEGASVEESVSIEGISEECTLLEGQIHEEDAKEMAKELLTTAQADEQLQELLTKWSEAMPEAGDLNAQFQSFAEETLADLESTDGTEESGSEYIASRIWVNSEDKIVGREIAVCEGVDTDAVFTWKASADGDASALMVDMQSEGSGFTLTGSSQNTDGMENGNYSIAIDGVTIMEIAMENYDTKAAEEGYPSGTFTITFPQGQTEEEYNPLSMFSLVLSLVSDKEDESGSVNLEVLSSGASLGVLTIQGAESAEAVEAVAAEDMGTIYDAASEEDMKAYEEEMSFDTILANAESAGVPAELITVLEQSIESAMTGETIETPAEESALEEAPEETAELESEDAE